MDPQQQQQLAGMMAGIGAAAVFFGLLMMAFLIFLFWRIFSKAGMSGALALIAFVPGIGMLICLCILAFGQWRTGALRHGYAPGVQPPYPEPPYPQPPYPPQP